MENPKTEAELAEVIRAADGPLAVHGGSTQGVALEGQPVSTCGLSGVSLYEPGALTLVAGVGTPVQDIAQALAQEGQQLAFEPRDLRAVLGTKGEPTIGGVFATNLSGPRRIQAGAARDFLLGVRFVDGTGTVAKNGGRVMKNVTGYDLVKLLAGAHGTLGVLTEVSLKVLPRPEMTGVVLLYGLTPEQAVAAMSEALGSPFDVTGAAHTLRGMDGDPVTMIRVEGFEDSVLYRTQALKERLAQFGEPVVETDPDKTAAGWKWVRDLAPLRDADGDIWSISVKPSDAPGVLDKLNPNAALLDWGGGLIWALTPKGKDVRAAMGDTKGHATLIRGTGFPRFHPEPAPVASLAQGLRNRFDPRGILNPGLMG
ncbi:MAG: FAD-binding protein [Paracoccaceae bacterium]